MKYNSYDERMEPESVEEFAEILVNMFANSNNCETCTFRNNACDEIWPHEDTRWCTVIDIAKNFGLSVDLSKRKKFEDLRKIVQTIYKAKDIESTIASIESSIHRCLVEIDKCKRSLGIEVSDEQNEI